MKTSVRRLAGLAIVILPSLAVGLEHDGNLIETLGKPPQRWRDIVISPNNGRVAWLNAEQAGITVTIDGKVSEAYQSAEPPIFSADSLHTAYAALKDGKWCAVVDSVPGKPYQQLASLTFSPDGKRTAYIAYDEKSEGRLIIDGKEGKLYGYLENVVFSPDSRRIAYVRSCQQVGWGRRRGQRWLMAWNKREAGRIQC